MLAPALIFLPLDTRHVHSLLQAPRTHPMRGSRKKLTLRISKLHIGSGSGLRPLGRGLEGMCVANRDQFLFILIYQRFEIREGIECGGGVFYAPARGIALLGL